MLGCRIQSFVLHYCVVGGLILSGVHLVWLMGHLLLLVSFAFVLLSYTYLLGYHGFLVCDCCFTCIWLCDLAKLIT